MVKGSAEMESARRQRGKVLEEQRVDRNPGPWAGPRTGRGMAAQGFPLVSPVTSPLDALIGPPVGVDVGGPGCDS